MSPASTDTVSLVSRRLKDSTEEASSPDTSHLCEYCKCLQFKIKDIYEGKDDGTFRNWKSITASSSTCALCKLIMGDRLPTLEGPLSIYTVHRSQNGISNLIIKDSPGASWTTLPIHLSLLVSEDSASTRHISGRRIKPQSDLGCAKRWLKDCLENHDHGPNTKEPRPARLVAVGTEDGSQPISLVGGPITDTEYLALSHCWGQGLPFRTMKSNSRSLTIEIPWDLLPKTFQDAIQIARGLGVGYLWIDALCIVQDDSLDWEMESAKMAGIYNNALLTIMAASTSDSHGGCFKDPVGESSGVLIPYTDEAGTTSLSIFVNHAPRGFRSVINNGPLFRRGWVFQERSMSKRKLLFGEDQLYWECNDTVKTETGMSDEWEHIPEHQRCDPVFRVFSEPHMQFSDAIKTRFSLWNEAIEIYSGCALTYPADRLPSLSGLAHTYGQRTGYTYAAGLWLEEMPEALLWYIPTTGPRNNEHQYIAPSWSWASIKGTVYFPDVYSPEDYGLEILQADIKLASGDSHGRVSAGSSILVKGKLRAAWLVRIRDPLVLRGNVNHRGAPYVKDEHGSVIGSATLDEDRDDLPLSVHCLEVLPHGVSTYLILAQVGEEAAFRRLGIGNNIGSDRENLWFDGIEKTEIILI